MTRQVVPVVPWSIARITCALARLERPDRDAAAVPDLLQRPVRDGALEERLRERPARVGDEYLAAELRQQGEQLVGVAPLVEDVRREDQVERGALEERLRCGPADDLHLHREAVCVR